MFTSPIPSPHSAFAFYASGPAHRAGHCTIAFKEAVRVDMAGAVGWAVAGPSWEAALALVAQEAQATGATLERALREGEHSLRKEGRPTSTQDQHCHLRGAGWARSYVSGLPVISGSPHNLSK